MSIAADIRAALSLVPTRLGDTWSYRARTSAPGVEPRTYGSWSTAGALFTGASKGEDYGDNGMNFRKERGALRVGESVVLTDGDQVRGPDGTTVWDVVGIQSQGYGTIRYDVCRDVPLIVQANRGSVL